LQLQVSQKRPYGHPEWLLSLLDYAVRTDRKWIPVPRQRFKVQQHRVLGVVQGFLDGLAIDM
jgi:hypothetical protein